MSGYGDRAWREIARRMGCALVVVPIVSAEGLARDDVKTSALIDIAGEPPPIAVQLFGARAEPLAEAARRVEALGASAVDLNLGCPARRVVQNEGGAALLRYPDRVARLVAAMRRAVTIPLTVKMRAGWDVCGPPAVEIARIVAAEGADALTVHGRTGRQQFKGAADWQPIAEIKAAVAIPVIGNGDVRTGEDAWRMRRETGCDAVMIGRGALGNPWLLRDALAWLAADGPPHPESLPPPTLPDRIDMLVAHARLMARYRGEPRGIIEFRKHAVHYLKGVRDAKRLKQQLVAATTLAQVEHASCSYYPTVGEEVEGVNAAAGRGTPGV
jgi:nifR3 family TIM-barrel protein